MCFGSRCGSHFFAAALRLACKKVLFFHDEDVPDPAGTGALATDCERFLIVQPAEDGGFFHFVWPVNGSVVECTFMLSTVGQVSMNLITVVHSRQMPSRYMLSFVLVAESIMNTRLSVGSKLLLPRPAIRGKGGYINFFIADRGVRLFGEVTCVICGCGPLTGFAALTAPIKLKINARLARLHRYKRGGVMKS